MKKHIVILGTGGTIAGKAASNTEMTGYEAGALGIQMLLDAVPEVMDAADVSGEQFCNQGSFDMTWDTILNLSKKVNSLLKSNSVDGIVITHGTDTLEETAYFLNLTVKSAKPVVVTGAMRPATAISADGPVNLLNAVSLAASEEAAGQGVLIAMNDQINGARDCSKTNTTHVETFKAFELGYLGYFQNGRPVFYRKSTRKHTFKTCFDIMNVKTLPKVDIIYSYISCNAELAEAAAAAGAQGLVIAALGHGNIHKDMLPGLAALAAKGTPVVRSSRVGNGIVSKNYLDDQYGFIAADSLNAQKARILLMLALLQTNDSEKIRSLFAEY